MARLTTLVLTFAVFASPAAAQTPAPDAPPLAPSTQPPRPAEPEQNLINLSTTLPMKRHGSYFRLTHRFARDLRRGSFGDLAASLFSLDDGAVFGLEYRFAPTSQLQTGIHRSMLSKTIEFLGRYDGWRQGSSLPLSLSFVASVEGTDNFSDDHSPAAGLVLSRVFGDVVALYASPMFVWNSRLRELPEASDLAAEGRNTLFLGLGGRVRFMSTAYVSFEISPRLSGYDPLLATWGVAVEKHTWGHMFQLNFTNSFGTTYGQIARGGSEHDVYLGFNITRTF